MRPHCSHLSSHEEEVKWGLTVMSLVWRKDDSSPLLPMPLKVTLWKGTSEKCLCGAEKSKLWDQSEAPSRVACHQVSRAAYACFILLSGGFFYFFNTSSEVECVKGEDVSPQLAHCVLHFILHVVLKSSRVSEHLNGETLWVNSRALSVHLIRQIRWRFLRSKKI